ncbi:MAG: hypothetical protein WBA74_25755 [Cyclobacteriaceae bacterium]
MEPLLKYINEISIQWLVLIIGLVGIRRLPIYMKVLLLQVVVFVINFHMGRNKTFQNEAGENTALYNIYSVLEVLILIWAAGLYLKTARFRKVLIFCAVSAIIAFVLSTAIYGINSFAKYNFCLYSLIIAGIYLYILFVRINYEGKSRLLNPWTLIILGLIVFYTCMAPFMAMLEYLNNNFAETSNVLYLYILAPLSNIRYFLLAVGLLLAVKEKSGNSQQLTT